MLNIQRSASGVVFWIHVTPRSREARVGGSHGDALRVRVTPPPVGGAANDACVRALARALEVGVAGIAVERGSRGRRKRVHVSGDAEVLSARLLQLAGEASSG